MRDNLALPLMWHLLLCPYVYAVARSDLGRMCGRDQKGHPKAVSRCCRMPSVEVPAVVEACMKMVRAYKTEASRIFLKSAWRRLRAVILDLTSYQPPFFRLETWFVCGP